MSSGSSTYSSHARRALLILGVLASLCVSDDGGLRLLLPQPPPPEHAAAERRPENASRAPAHSKAALVRVEMAATAQSRVEAGRKPTVILHAHRASFVPLPASSSVGRAPRPPLLETSAFTSRQKDRAPPRAH